MPEPLPTLVLYTRRKAVCALGASVCAAAFPYRSVASARKGDMQRIIDIDGTLAPSIALHDMEGNPVYVNELSGSVKLINFWASWCAPCVEELPTLSALAKHYASSDLGVHLINWDVKRSAKIDGFLANLGINNLQSLYDPNWKYGKALGTRALPTTFFAKQNGEILSYFVGPTDWNHPDTHALIDDYLRNNV